MSSYFETIKIENGEVCHIEWHQKRYEETLRHIGGGMVYALADFIKMPKKGLWRCKIVYNENGIEEIAYFPYVKRKIRSLRLIESDIEYPFKKLDRDQIDTLFTQRNGCDEILITKNGFLRDTSIANVAFFDNSRWLTPDTPLLPGTTMRRYIDTGKITPATVTKKDISCFSKIAFLNAMVDFAIMSIEKIKKDEILVK